MSNEMLIKMVRDLEETRWKYMGYPYVRTMRNILTGNTKACIAPLFKDKPYYGQYQSLQLSTLETIMDSLVRSRLLDVIYTDRGKMYCTLSESTF